MRWMWGGVTTHLGCSVRARENKALISFSPSPRYLLVTFAAVTEKKAKPDSNATALASSVFPVPGGPNNSTPLGGDRSPRNKAIRVVTIR